ncbi:chromatin modification-related protein eaf3 [Phtheirospermum japonicum]|uniref:Chromatin modification-related protein eaf3 n=1 Tax=Phtheirospermum japonicum TaxID=374723 RepID=A0A830BF62_9LAMI|nr:chromatin modification-related protein eaf3 [Phtheirospermum japonicum]
MSNHRPSSPNHPPQPEATRFKKGPDLAIVEATMRRATSPTAPRHRVHPHPRRGPRRRPETLPPEEPAGPDVGPSELLYCPKKCCAFAVSDIGEGGGNCRPIGSVAVTPAATGRRTTVTESSITPFSGVGNGGGTISSATNKPMKDEAVDSSPFRVGEKVLAFHGPCLYDAKVQKVEFHRDEWSWDEWLDVTCLLKHTDENVRKQEELNKEHGMEKSAKLGRILHDKTKSSIGVRGKKREREIIEKEECLAPSEKLVNIQIPATLKKQLVDDHECITHLGQLVKLPRSPSVFDILNKYFDYRTRKDGMIVETVAEIVKGLRCYFNKALPAMLLYKEERQQYEEVIADNVTPSGVYGAEHLLRLFVKLPEMLSCMPIEIETLAELQLRLQDFLRFLQSNQSAFFQSNYQISEGFVAVVKKEEN